MESQTTTDREVLVVDDGSTDGTASLAKDLVRAKGYADVRVIESKHGGPAHARNAGLKEASGPVVFFAECDCTYDPEYIAKALEAFKQNPGASAVCLTGAPMMTRKTVATRCIVIENKVQHRLLEQGKMKPFYAWVFRRETISALGGYDERLTQAEDRDLFDRFRKAGYSLAWVPGVHWWHRRDQTMAEVARESVRRGRARVPFVLKRRLARDAVKAVVPLWLFVAGIVMIPLLPVVGLVLAAGVTVFVVVRALRVVPIVWNDVPSRWWFAAYPFFALVRNFSSGIGYTAGLADVALGRRRTRQSTGAA